MRTTLPARWIWLTTGAALVAACSEDGLRPSALDSTGAGARGPASTGAGALPNEGGEAGSAGDGGGDTGSGGSMIAAVIGCGDGVRVATEACDGEDLGRATCETLGYDGGDLACSFDCSFDDSDCQGDERCADGHDNDKDGLSDCQDGDCSLACESPCEGRGGLFDPATVSASTAGRGAVEPSSCLAPSAAPGPAVAYTFTAGQSGRVELELESETPHFVALLGGGCNAETELACDDRRLSEPVQAGTELTIVVQSFDAAGGAFELRVATRPHEVCGDGYRDPSEACEDGGTEPLDGCSADCELERAEDEPNASVATAEAYGGGYVASIDPAGDQDLVAVSVSRGPASISARTFGFLDDCDTGRADTYLELLGSDASSVLDADDDEAEGYCSRVLASGLAQGTYYLRVRAASSAEFPTFPYRLSVTVNTCGDGVRGPGEACDDYNQNDGDGCSAACESE